MVESVAPVGSAPYGRDREITRWLGQIAAAHFLEIGDIDGIPLRRIFRVDLQFDGGAGCHLRQHRVDLIKLMMGGAAGGIRPVGAVAIGEVRRAIHPAILRGELQVAACLVPLI